MIPYGKQSIDNEDLDSVIEVLKSDWLTTGPKIEEFERSFSNYVGSKFSIALNSGTAALHSVMNAIGVKKGDEVIVPTMTFAATANCILYQDGIPIFADVEDDTLLIDPIDVERKISPNTKAIIAVDYAGHPVDYDALHYITKKHNIYLISDSCHAIGGKYKGREVGSIADFSTFSFHPVKNMTTGEGGMVTTNNQKLAQKIKTFRNHGITSDHRERAEKGSWFYEMHDLGYNYRITDFQCALGISQLKKLPNWIKKRNNIAKIYDNHFSDDDFIKPLALRKEIDHAYHLYVVKLDFNELNLSRALLFKKMKENKININVHYIPVHLHPFYKRNFGFKKGHLPVAEAAYEQIISLPIFPGLQKESVDYIVSNLKKITS